MDRVEQVVKRRVSCRFNLRNDDVEWCQAHIGCVHFDEHIQRNVSRGRLRKIEVGNIIRGDSLPNSRELLRPGESVAEVYTSRLQPVAGFRMCVGCKERERYQIASKDTSRIVTPNGVA